jgi:integrase
MGCIYRLKKKDKSLRSPFWWLKYIGVDGRPQYESSKKTDHREAKAMLAEREGKVAKGEPVTSAVGRLTFKEAADNLLTDYKNNDRSTDGELESRLRLHLLPYFGRRRMVEINTAMINRYIAKRRADRRVVRMARTIRRRDGTRIETPAVTKPYANASINRELEHLERCFTLAVEADLLLHTPHVPYLDESQNVRKGFLEPRQLEDLLSHLPAVYRPLVLFTYLTGWRMASEVLPLEWRQVDFALGEVRLDEGSTKSGEGRVFGMNDDIRLLLEDQRRVTEALQRKTKKMIPLVFHRDGASITSFYKAWRTACLKAGIPGRIPHDMCRSSARNMVTLRGVPQKVAQELMGRKTAAIFDRYHIVSNRDLHDGAAKLNGIVDMSAVKPKVKLAAVIGSRSRSAR